MEFDEEVWDYRERQETELYNQFSKAWASALKPRLAGQDIVSRPIHHYTTLPALAGIIDDRCFWASDVRYMNDASELTYASNLIDEEVERVRRDPANRELFESLTGMERLADPFQFDYGQTPYITCFCEVDDLLSQWRGYGTTDSVSLRLDLAELATHLANPSVRMRKVVYSPPEQRELVRQTIDSWIRTVRGLVDEGVDPGDLLKAGALWELVQAMLDFHLCFKSPAFREEREWRLIKLVNTTSEIKRMTGDLPSEKQLSPIISIYPPEGADIEFRQSSYGFTPFVKVAACDDAGDRLRIPIIGVRQGPRAHAEIALKSLELFMASKGYRSDDTPVRTTRVPLRR